MTTHKDRRIIPHTPENLFALVADVEKYPEFLPWCVATRITARDAKSMRADMVVGFKLYRETFTSQVSLNREAMEITADYIDGPFSHMRNLWKFNPHAAGCEIDFFVDFEFKSRLFQSVMATLFAEAVRRMVHAFETRADDLYDRVSSAPE